MASAVHRLLLQTVGLLLVIGCSDHLKMGEGSVTDVDGNTYRTVRIGDQWWMAENLRVKHYADGMPIPDGSLYSTCPLEPLYFAEGRATRDAHSVAGETVFYNWPAVMRDQVSSNTNPSGVQGLAPDGWHVPSLAEWRQLHDHLRVAGNGGPGTDAAKKLKGAQSTSGFDALKAGAWWQGGPFASSRNATQFWSSTVMDRDDIPHAMCVRLDDQPRFFVDNGANQAAGWSVRCVKD